MATARISWRARRDRPADIAAFGPSLLVSQKIPNYRMHLTIDIEAFLGRGRDASSGISAMSRTFHIYKSSPKGSLTLDQKPGPRVKNKNGIPIFARTHHLQLENLILILQRGMFIIWVVISLIQRQPRLMLYMEIVSPTILQYVPSKRLT